MPNTITVRLACELNENVNDQISAIFVDGFYQWLMFFTKDKAKLQKAFRHMFNPNVFYVALSGPELAGIAACTDGKIPSVRLDSAELRKHMGFLRGSIAYTVLKKEFEEKQYPFAITQGLGLIEFVATSAKYRGKGVASTLLEHIFASTPYTEYALEVADTNTKAVKLYERLGFSEFMRIKQKHSKRSGVNNLVYMKTNRN